MSSPDERGKPTLAVVGATGAVGTVLLALLSERVDCWGEIRLAASPDSAGRVVNLRGEDAVVRPLDVGLFDGADVAIFVAPADVAVEWAPTAAEHCVVVDASGAFHADPDVPLVMREHNGAQVRNRPRGIVATPSGVTRTMMSVVGTLHARWELAGLVVTALEPASEAGRAGVDRLHEEIRCLAGDRRLGTMTGDVRRRVDADVPGPSPFPAASAFNVVPWVGDVADADCSDAEERVRVEAGRLVGVPGLPVSATCVRVPVVTGQSLSVHAHFLGQVSVDEARRILVEAPSVVVVDDPGRAEWPTPVDIVGSDPTFVGRLRRSPGTRDRLDMFVCGDNLRQGAALDAVQVAELVNEELVSRWG